MSCEPDFGRNQSGRNSDLIHESSRVCSYEPWFAKVSPNLCAVNLIFDLIAAHDLQFVRQLFDFVAQLFDLQLTVRNLQPTHWFPQPRLTILIAAVNMELIAAIISNLWAVNSINYLALDLDSSMIRPWLLALALKLGGGRSCFSVDADNIEIAGLDLA